MAGATGLPALDAMTLAFHVADRSFDAGTNGRRFLDRMRLVYSEARRARELGMLGTWVGHPAQLFATLLALDPGFDLRSLEVEARKLEAYRTCVDGLQETFVRLQAGTARGAQFLSLCNTTRDSSDIKIAGEEPP